MADKESTSVSGQGTCQECNKQLNVDVPDGNCNQLIAAPFHNSGTKFCPGSGCMLLNVTLERRG